MTDQFETTNTLDFGQQAMNVVVRAKVNASTDYGSLTASLLQQRDKKQKAIRELEATVLRELGPKLDEVYDLEAKCKDSAMQVELMEEKVDMEKDRCAKAKALGETEAEADQAKMVQLLNERAKTTEELERVLLSLSTDPEMKRIQTEHEQEKADVTKRSMILQEQLRTSESAERAEGRKVEAKLDGVIHTARNLGQIAVYFLQTGAMEEAANFFMRAKAIFDDCLGTEHPQTVQWHEDLFFLIHAPTIQAMVKDAQRTIAPPEGFDASALDAMEDEGGMPAQNWWMGNLFDMNTRTGDRGDEDEDLSSQWWMQNLYTMGSHSSGPRVDDSAEEASYMHVIFGTPRGGTNTSRGVNTARGGPAFTPRGTLVALSQAGGKAGAALSLGMPLKQAGIPENSAAEDAVNMGFAKDWVTQIFATPRGHGGDDDEKSMALRVAEAAQWLHENFGLGGVSGSDTATSSGSSMAGTRTPRTAEMENAYAAMSQLFTPRGKQDTSLRGLTVKTDDAVMAAAMKAALSTPRQSSQVVDDAPMAGAVNKMFKGRQAL